MSEEYSQPPFIDIALPPAFVLSYLSLITIYAFFIGLDLILLKKEKYLPVTRKQLCILIGFMHALIPLVFISPSMLLNVLFAAAPWFFATYAIRMSIDQLEMSEFVSRMIKITTEPSQQPTSKIRWRGAATCSLGVLKWSFMHLFIDPLLPHRSVFVLYYSWFHPLSLVYTLLYGIKAYCLLGAVDVFMGLEQVVMGWNMVSLFNSPILSTSPRDFWSRRWNKVVRNLLHTQVFVTYDKNQVMQKTGKYGAQNMNFRNSKFIFPKKYGRGLTAFFVSGVFHELTVMSACRRITLENLLFFTLQGVAVSIEIALRQGVLKQEPEGKTRALCIAAQIVFMACTGRLFLGPFLRYGFVE